MVKFLLLEINKLDAQKPYLIQI